MRVCSSRRTDGAGPDGRHTPIVDDPLVPADRRGQRASDVYAMGGRPLTALAMPRSKKASAGHDSRDLPRRFRHAARRERVAPRQPPHSQDQIKFGYAVTGAVDPARIYNAGAQLATCSSPSRSAPASSGRRSSSIARRPAGGRGRAIDAHAQSRRGDARCGRSRRCGSRVPDIRVRTGRPRLRIARASGVSLRLQAATFRVQRVAELAAARSGGLGSSEHFGADVRVSQGVDPAQSSSSRDPQTSGGLLIAANPSRADQICCSSARGRPRGEDRSGGAGQRVVPNRGRDVARPGLCRLPGLWYKSRACEFIRKRRNATEPG
jgi:selenide,water dikinase